ncbi:hypothetical protein BC831DRAFT_259132 [Entophlyctis helioformis]|nr:hypothetical protein BC831DRAFT_259132 [Entophlyctis helioformis]
MTDADADARTHTDAGTDADTDADTDRPLVRIAKTAARAYTTAYGIVLLPRLLGLLIAHVRSKSPSKRLSALWPTLARLMRRGLLARTPWAFLALFGGFAALDDLLPRLALRWSSSALSASRSIEHVSGNTRLLQQQQQQLQPPAHLARQQSFPDLQPSLRRRLTMAAAVLSSTAAFALIHPSSRLDFALFVLVRTVDSVCTSHYARIVALKPSWLPAWLLDHGGAIAFQLSCWEIMYSWFYHPTALPSSYTKWITRMGGMDTRLIQMLRDVKSGRVVYGRDLGHQDYLRDYAAELGLPRAMGDPVHGPIPCLIAHGGIHGCVNHTVFVWRNGFFDALKLYLPVHILPALVFGIRKISTPADLALMLGRSAVGALRSSTFLASFIGIIWATICAGRQFYNRGDRPIGQNLGSFLCGFSIFLERPSRRREMALYTVPKAIEALVTRCVPARWSAGGVHSGRVRYTVESAVFSACMCYLLATFKHHPRDVRPALRSLLAFFVV